MNPLQIIKQPMDFSTIRSKLDAGAYTTLDAFRHDFKLMCDNAMTYNALETIYYKTAKRLQQTGVRLLTQGANSLEKCWVEIVTRNYFHTLITS